MDEDHSLQSPNEDGDYTGYFSSPDDNQVEGEAPPSRRWKIIITVIVALLLLMLFCPVPKDQLRKMRQQSRKEQAKLAGNVGKTRYTVLSGAPMLDIGSSSRKAFPVGVWFEVENLSGRAEVLDYSMVTLKEVGGKTYEAFPPVIEEWYQRNDQHSPWAETVGAGQKVKALGIFYAFRGSKKTFFLVGRDFGWMSGNSGEFLVDSFDTLGN